MLSRVEHEKSLITSRPGSDVIIHFSCSTQLSMVFQMPIKSKILIDEGFSCFQMLRCCIYHAHKY